MSADLTPALEECERRIEAGIATFVEVGSVLIEAEERYGTAGMEAAAVAMGVDLAMLRPLMPFIRSVVG